MAQLTNDKKTLHVVSGDVVARDGALENTLYPVVCKTYGSQEEKGSELKSLEIDVTQTKENVFSLLFVSLLLSNLHKRMKK